MCAEGPYSLFPVINSGIDWLTCTNVSKAFGNPLERFGESILQEKFAAHGQVCAAKALGYVGLRAEGIFLGRSAQGVLLQLSGPTCTPLAMDAISVSTGVSRIDTQVTVFTEGEQPHLAAWTYNKLLKGVNAVGRPAKFGVIQSYPDGETLQLGSRSSESFGRLYDKTAEAKLGAPRLVWRYEVEWKGKRARWVAARLERDGCSPTTVSWLVHAFYSRRGVRPAFEPPTVGDAPQLSMATPTRDVLAWYRSSLSLSIAKSINQHGAPAVLDALGISNLVKLR